METVQSADGTTLAYDRVGTGPALVITLGAFCDRGTARSLAGVLSEHFTVYAYDRRGRGDSGDTPPYDTGREIEDLAAIIEAAGGHARAFGHSSGAAIVLRAAARGLPIDRVAAYEPPYTEFDDLRGRIVADLAAGRRDEAVRRFLTEAVQVPAAGIEGMRQSPMWPGLVALAHTLPYDLAFCVEPVDELPKVAVPVLMVDGANSPQWMRDGVARAAKTVHNGHRVSLTGQDHGAADEVLAPVLVEFFNR